MLKKISLVLLSFILAGTIAASPSDAITCAKACRKAIRLCQVSACTRLRGALKAGCKRGIRITVLGACKVGGDRLQVCAQFEANGCSN
jgi:hypothetical protein